MTSIKMDPVTLAILKGRLEQIADEMDATLFRSAFNPIIAEAHDASHGIYDAQTGETLVQGKSGLPIFVGVMAFAVKAVIERVERDGGVADGDVFIFNDPYDGGTHLSDFRLVKPIFRNGEIFCYLASVGHWHDVGGNVPGNYTPQATESFQEGMLIPPVKLFEAGVLKSDIVAILSANSRLPNSLYGDMNAQINALELGHQRLADLRVLQRRRELVERRQLDSVDRHDHVAHRHAAAADPQRRQRRSSRSCVLPEALREWLLGAARVGLRPLRHLVLRRAGGSVGVVDRPGVRLYLRPRPHQIEKVFIASPYDAFVQALR